jgi:predicted dehydrogenase
VVQDKLWLPGMLKLAKLRDEGFFGKILSVRGEFGYWVFEGDARSGQPPAQRPSWNYRKQDGGGIILDMLCHWRYVLDNLFGEVKAVSCLGATHIPFRWDEAGKKYKATADDAAYCHLQAGRRRDRALQLLVDRARASRRPAHAAGGRHQGKRGRRLARLSFSKLCRNSQTSLESGHSPADQFL